MPRSVAARAAYNFARQQVVKLLELPRGVRHQSAPVIQAIAVKLKAATTEESFAEAVANGSAPGWWKDAAQRLLTTITADVDDLAPVAAPPPEVRTPESFRRVTHRLRDRARDQYYKENKVTFRARALSHLAETPSCKLSPTKLARQIGTRDFKRFSDFRQEALGQRAMSSSRVRGRDGRWCEVPVQPDDLPAQAMAERLAVKKRRLSRKESTRVAKVFFDMCEAEMRTPEKRKHGQAAMVRQFAAVASRAGLPRQKAEALGPHAFSKNVWY